MADPLESWAATFDLQSRANTIAFGRMISQAQNAFNEAIGSFSFFLIPSSKQMINQMEQVFGAATLLAYSYEQIKERFIPLVKTTLLSIIDAKTAGLEEGAFPAAYRAHIHNAILAMPTPEVLQLGQREIVVELPSLFIALGDEKDFYRGFHDEALLATGAHGTSGVQFRNRRFYQSGIRQRSGYTSSGRRVQLPYYGEQLAAGTSTRYLAWKALYEGKTSYTIHPFRNKSTALEVKFPEGSSFQATVNRRIAVWGNKAPEWLLLEYGQVRYAPIVPVGLQYKGVSKDIQFSAGGVQLENPFVNISIDEAGITPANLTGSWVLELQKIFNSLIVAAWNQQLQEFNNLRFMPSTPAAGGGLEASTAASIESLVRVVSQRYGVLYMEFAEFQRAMAYTFYSHDIGPYVLFGGYGSRRVPLSEFSAYFNSRLIGGSNE